MYKKIDMHIAYFRLQISSATFFLNFYDVMWLQQLLRIDVLLNTTIRQLYDVINIQNGGAREILEQKYT